ncbi:hypothetical protein OEZ85_007501 [Tetradesmus obliquus]|uniref:F-box domain-containing protein n=1 Tax=Tetradesmus obliquus TaxID=3088 RepID=A0ABY8TI93_TETOB|nr:hypothetical protein OEZ85_007501 [Tetradesmus obliquus]
MWALDWITAAAPGLHGLPAIAARTRHSAHPGHAASRRSPPRQLLQMLGSYLEPADVAAARLVCKDWRELLSAQEVRLALPHNEPQNQACNAWALARAMDTFRAHLPTLQRLELAGILQPAHWRAALDSMQCLAPQLRGLTLSDICWPPPASLHQFNTLTALQRLTIRSPHFSRLEEAHLAAIAGLTQLQELGLCFRTVEGSAHAPLSLDPLAALVRLTSLDVQYTGLLELASAVVFCGPRALCRFSSLVRMRVSLVPVPCLTSLAALPQLCQLTLQQSQPVSGPQCNSLASCRQLHSLALSSVQWADIQKLAPLTNLRSLAVQIHQPVRGALPAAAAGRQLLQLKQLRSLRSLTLKGQCELSTELLLQLARCWGSMTQLDLCCNMPDGTLGLQQFSALRSLCVQPYKWDVWSSDPPVLLYPSLLPPSLTSLEALDVCTSPCAERRLAMPDLSLCSSLESLELHHSQLNQCHLAHIAASCPCSLRSLKLVAVDDSARIRASGLTILTKLTVLTQLSIHAHERAINKNVRRAISSMSQLRSLTLLTSPDYPTSFARSLACLTQLSNLVVLRVGLGFGALDALRRLGSQVGRALPHCSYQMLTDTCVD